MCRFIAKYIVDSQMSSAKENATPDKPVVGPRFELGRHFCSLIFFCVCVCEIPAPSKLVVIKKQMLVSSPTSNNSIHSG